jgi:hypothetical protein
MFLKSDPARLARPLILSIIVSATAGAAPVDILFVGNSFTHGHNEPVMSFNNTNVTDENSPGTPAMGGVPGIFKQLTVQAGLTYNVSIEAVSSTTLATHYTSKSSIIGQAKWDTVVLQEQSTTPLPSSRGGTPTAFYTAAANLKNLVRANNASADVLLYETWSSPASVTAQGYSSGTTGLHAMQQDLQDAYFKAYYDSGFTGVARVGDAFMNAVDRGAADSNPSDGVTAGMINLWNTDYRHASKWGSYLSAAVFYAKITHNDPRALSATASNSAALALGISSTDAATLNTIAYEINALANPALTTPPATVVTRVPVSQAGATGAVANRSITGNTAITSITTTEGTFTNLIGATANNVISTQVSSSVGTAPTDKNAAATGLSANDGVNNLTSGNFQFGGTFGPNTRFFIVESTLASGTIGDDVSVTLIDANNNAIGTWSMNLVPSDFTSSAANNTSNALATLTYDNAVASLQGSLSKLGAVSFSLADLGITDYAAIDGASGIRLTSSTLDPNVVGMYTVVPEPGAVGVLALVAGGLLRRRRRGF